MIENNKRESMNITFFRAVASLVWKKLIKVSSRLPDYTVQQPRIQVIFVLSLR
jgi:hypothetical protein